MTIRKTSTLSRLKDGNIVAGAGYSTDSQQVGGVCYNATVSSISGSHSVLELDTALSFSDIQREVEYSVTLKGGIGMFSASAEASYLQSMEDTDYSMSLNYFTYSYATASVQLADVGLNALNAFGKSAYTNNATYPYFGLLCGDKYITSYYEGAMLIMGINIQFSSHYAKTQFEAHGGASFGNIISASGNIQQIATQYSITGSVVMQASQTGGDPSQLGHILNKDGNGDYYVLTCSLNAMDNCVHAASGMLDYATNNFTTQFSFVNNTGLTPLGTGFMESRPIIQVGLIPPPSFFTPQVIQDRDTLADALLENQYYEQKLYSLLSGYPVTWDTTSSLYATLQTLYQTAQNNINVLMDPNSGSIGCYDEPYQCDTITQNINASLVPITADDLSALQLLQLILPGDFATYYFSGNGYGALPMNYGNGDSFHDLASLTLTNTTFNSVIHWCGSYNNCNTAKWTACSTTSSSDGITYHGDYTRYGNGWTSSCSGSPAPVTYNKVISPFWFEPYNSSNSYPEIVGEAPAQDIVHT